MDLSYSYLLYMCRYQIQKMDIKDYMELWKVDRNYIDEILKVYHSVRSCTCKIVKIVRLYPNFSYQNMIVIPKRATIVYVQRPYVWKKPLYGSTSDVSSYV